MIIGGRGRGYCTGMVDMQLREIRARRLIAQRLSPTTALEPLRTPLEAATWMTATQGQTYKAGIRALGLRSGCGDDAVHEAVEKREIVRSWPQRGTLHFTAAVDARWLMRLGNPRVARQAAHRRPGLGLDPGDLEVARRVLHDALLAADAPIARPDCYALFAAAGIDPSEGRGPHLIRALGGEGEVVQGPQAGRHDTFYHVDQLPEPHVQPADPAAESARRYTLSHGPVTVKDFVWWSGLTVAEARNALLRAAMTDDVIQEGEYFLGEWQKGVTPEEIEAALNAEYHLPAFDEYLLGYSDKSYALPVELRPRVLTMNGISWDFVVRNGVAVGREGD